MSNKKKIAKRYKKLYPVEYITIWDLYGGRLQFKRMRVDGLIREARKKLRSMFNYPA